MIPVVVDPLIALAGFPRVSGDDPGSTMEDMQAAMFSPRERG